MLAIWSLVPLPFVNPAWTSGSSQFTYCWSMAWRILSITLLACESESYSVVSNSLQPPWNSPGQNIGVGSLSLLQGIFRTQGSNPGLLHCWQILYQLSHMGVRWVQLFNSLNILWHCLSLGLELKLTSSSPVALKLNIQKTKIWFHHFMANRWGNNGNSGETIFLGSKITSDSDCSHEIRRHLLLGRKAMTNIDSMLKSKDVTLLTKVHLVKAMVFPVVMYGCENWIIKKAEHHRIDAFELWYWRRLWESLGLQGDPTSPS